MSSRMPSGPKKDRRAKSCALIPFVREMIAESRCVALLQ